MYPGISGLLSNLKKGNIFPPRTHQMVDDAGAVKGPERLRDPGVGGNGGF